MWEVREGEEEVFIPDLFFCTYFCDDVWNGWSFEFDTGGCLWMKKTKCVLRSNEVIMYCSSYLRRQ